MRINTKYLFFFQTTEFSAPESSYKFSRFVIHLHFSKQCSPTWKEDNFQLAGVQYILESCKNGPMISIFLNSPPAAPPTWAETAPKLVPLGSGKRFKIGSWRVGEGTCQGLVNQYRGQKNRFPWEEQSSFHIFWWPETQTNFNRVMKVIGKLFLHQLLWLPF